MSDPQLPLRAQVGETPSEMPLGLVPIPREIYVSGRMGVGKSTMAEVLRRTYGYGKSAFAEPLKQEVADRHGLSLAELELNKAKYRSELQEVGQGRRNENPHYWIERFIERREASEVLTVCVDDTRYTNEHLMGIQRGLVIRVQVPEEVRFQRLMDLYGAVTKEQLLHSSESEIDVSPYHIMLSGNLPVRLIPIVFETAYLNWVLAGRPVVATYPAIPKA